MAPGSRMVFDAPSVKATTYALFDAREASRADYGLSGRAMALRLAGSDGLPLFQITLAPMLALRIAAIATVCGVLAALAPARRAAALDPAQAIRI